jgi:hypothetical protein
MLERLPVRRIAAPVTVASALALGAGLIVGVPASAVAPPSAESVTASVSADAPRGADEIGSVPAPRPRVLGTVYEAGKFVYDEISACLANQEVGLECTSGDGDSIRAIYQKLREIEVQMEKNQAVLVERFGSLERLLEQVNIKLDRKQLVAIEKHMPLSQWALDALVECAQVYSKALPAAPSPADIEKAKKSVQCQPYAGRANGVREPLTNFVVATAETQGYFLREVDKMSQFGTLEAMSATFAGTTPSNHRDGMAWAIWLHEVGEQNRGSGATAKANSIPQGMTPVVTKSLSKKVNAAMAYWDQTFNTYGMLKVVAAGLKHGPIRATERQIAVDREITCTPTRCDAGTVGDIAKRFRLPELHRGEMLFVTTDNSKLWKISDKPNLGQGSDLTINTLLHMSRSVNKYATMSGLFKYDPQSFAPAGPLANRPMYGVRVGYSRTLYEVCLRSLCLLETDPQTTGFEPLQTGVTVDASCWNPVNVEDKRPDWRMGDYDNYLRNPNMYTQDPRKFWKTGKDLYNQEIWSPVSMPWQMTDVRSDFAKVGEWGWGMAPACSGTSASITELRGAMRDMGRAATVNPYLGWK